MRTLATVLLCVLCAPLTLAQSTIPGAAGASSQPGAAAGSKERATAAPPSETRPSGRSGATTANETPAPTRAADLARSLEGRGSAARALFAPLPANDFRETPLEEVFRTVGKQTSTNVVVRWTRLFEAGVPRDAPITLKTDRLPLDQALWLVFGQLESAAEPLAYRAEQNVLLISTARDLGREMVTRVYDVRDLIQTRPREASIFTGHVYQIPRVTRVAVAPGVAGGEIVSDTYGSGTRVNASTSGDDPFNDDNDDAPERHMRELIATITASVEPESWDVNGGRGVVRAWRGSLLVHNTMAVHQQIAGLFVEKRP
ncbi:MAG: hypothetical protein AB7Q17_11930 [Phycisphaerae bacterium]